MLFLKLYFIYFYILLFLCSVEPSTNQVNKPINTEALTKWAGHIPSDVREDIDSVAPMLQRLGYDSHAYPPEYGVADDQVKLQSARLSEKQRAEFHQQIAAPMRGGLLDKEQKLPIL